mgnify:CR=1 FL=1
MTDVQRKTYEALEVAETWLKFVYKCRSSRRIQAAMKETQALVLIDPAELDQDSYLLGLISKMVENNSAYAT